MQLIEWERELVEWEQKLKGEERKVVLQIQQVEEWEKDLKEQGKQVDEKAGETNKAMRRMGWEEIVSKWLLFNNI